MSEAVNKHLIIAAAGTGGHVMPGIAVAREMISRGWTVSWIGTVSGMERGLVEKAGIEFDAVDFSGIRGKGFVRGLIGCFKLVRACFACARIVRRRKAAAFYSTGGYISVPAAFGAKTAGIPLFMMNCDAEILMSVRIVMPFATKIFCGFDGGCAWLAGGKAVITGNPVRKEILDLPGPKERFSGRKGPLKIFVFGGSLGARVLNETVPAALALFPEGVRPEVLHQCGAKNLEAARAAYENAGVRADVRPFIDDMASCYSEADLVICRAGATSVSELCAAGAASVLVPLVARTTSHQMSNATFMQNNGAAVCVPQKEFTARRLHEILFGLNRSTLIKMAEKAKSLAKADAAQTTCDVIEKVSAGAH